MADNKWKGLDEAKKDLSISALYLGAVGLWLKSAITFRNQR